LSAFCTRIPAADGVSPLEFVRTRVAKLSRALRLLEHVPRILFESEHTFYDTAADSRTQAVQVCGAHPIRNNRAMGMFDYYARRGPIFCPLCESELDDWQGKDQ
jgi:hypothetical protein